MTEPKEMVEIEDITFFMETIKVDTSEGSVTVYFMVPSLNEDQEIEHNVQSIEYKIVSYAIDKDAFTRTLSELPGTLMHLMSSFPVINDDSRLFDSVSPEQQKKLLYEYAMDIQKKPMRGAANIRYKNVIMYWGESNTDRPFQILHDTNTEKLAIVRHPRMSDFVYRLR